MKILYFGDVVGKVGRQGVHKMLPQLKRKHQPDVVIANAENLAHGTGITPKTIAELVEAGVDLFTSGNHVWDKPVGEELLQAPNPIVLRPANYGARKSGNGILEKTINGEKLLLINLQGQVYMKDEVDNPFHALDEILRSHPPKDYNAIFVDFHAEATSEKVAIGHYADGRASVVVGSHTHVPTADAHILPGGTAFITDVGMTGALDSVIGVKKESVLTRFLTGDKSRFEYAEEGTCFLNAVLADISANRKANTFEFIQHIVET
jgi:metallophosphoesterase (TIGR00282 family)